MKFLAVMGHEETRPLVRELFRKHRVTMFSNISIRGCNCQPTEFEEEAWWPSEESIGAYSSLCFAILDDDKALEVMEEIKERPVAVDPNFPARAFLMNVEQTG